MTDPKAWLLAVLLSTHLLDILHLILKVTDCPLASHHLLLPVRACPLHYTVHFGPMLLRRGLWHPIGHVSVVLRETRLHRSGFCSHPPPRLTCMVIVFVCLCVHMHTCRCIVCLDAHAHMCSLDQLFPAPLLLSTGNRRLGTNSSERCRVHRGCHVSATQYTSCCCFCLL